MNKEELTKAVDDAMAESKLALRGYRAVRAAGEEGLSALEYFVYCVDNLAVAREMLAACEKGAQS